MTVRALSMVAPLMCLLVGGCAYGQVSGRAPDYDYGAPTGPSEWGQQVEPAGWSQPGWDPAWDGAEQPGDLFDGQDVGSVEAFYDPLSGYGNWVESRWGRVFQPRIAAGWRPYVNGRWTPYRLWISNDPWGWATDHYGRWGFDQALGWVWVPGTTWGPHWVAFRSGGDVLGWAPVPPGINFSIGIGFGGGFGYNNWNSWYGPSWVWAPTAFLYQPGFGGRLLPYNVGFNYFQRSRWQNWTPWQAGRGWAGRPGQNYWRGNGPRGNGVNNRFAGGGYAYGGNRNYVGNRANQYRRDYGNRPGANFDNRRPDRGGFDRGAIPGAGNGRDQRSPQFNPDRTPRGRDAAGVRSGFGNRRDAATLDRRQGFERGVETARQPGIDRRGQQQPAPNGSTAADATRPDRQFGRQTGRQPAQSPGNMTAENGNARPGYRSPAGGTPQSPTAGTPRSYADATVNSTNQRGYQGSSPRGGSAERNASSSSSGGDRGFSARGGGNRGSFGQGNSSRGDRSRGGGGSGSGRGNGQRR